jgi:hypothetical protein
MDDNNLNDGPIAGDTAGEEQKSGAGIKDPGAVFNPTIQDMDLAPRPRNADGSVQIDDGSKKRPTVTVMCAVAGGVVIQLSSVPPDDAGLPADYKLGHRVALHRGANPGIDKAFFDYWKNENKGLGLVVEGAITAQDEQQPEADASDRKEVTEEQDKSADTSKSSTGNGQQ